MAYILACLMAALCFLVNRAALGYSGVKTVFVYSPVIEEISKTALAYTLGADILITHVVFGIIEAWYDWHSSDGTDFRAPVVSITGHSIFGATTILMLTLTGNIYFAVLTSICVHMMWNLATILMVR